MQVIKYRCDMCGQMIEEQFYKLKQTRMTREDGEYKEQSPAWMDVCDQCMAKIVSSLCEDEEEGEETQEQEKEDEQLPEEKTQKKEKRRYLTREQKEQMILGAWKRGDRTREEVAKITGLPMSEVMKYI